MTVSARVTVAPWAYWTPERVLAAARAWFDRHGEPPTAERWRNSTPGTPGTRTVIRLFGSWNAMVGEAGFTPRPAHRPGHQWTRDEVVQAIFEWAYRYGRAPKFADWLHPGERRPASRQVIRLFGSWNAGIVAAGYEPTLKYRTLEGYRKQAGAVARHAGAAAA